MIIIIIYQINIIIFFNHSAFMVYLFKCYHSKILSISVNPSTKNKKIIIRYSNNNMLLDIFSLRKKLRSLEFWVSSRMIGIQSL